MTRIIRAPSLIMNVIIKLDGIIDYLKLILALHTLNYNVLKKLLIYEFNLQISF